MDRKSITIIIACVALLIAWEFVIVPKLTPPPKPLPPGATNQTAQMPAQTNAAPAAAPVFPTVAPSAATQLSVNTNIPEQLIVASNSEARYTFTSYGGGLEAVELLKYPEKVATRRGKAPKQNSVATLNPATPAPTLAVLDGPAVQGDGIFSLTKTATGVRAEKTLTNGLRVVKEFSIQTNYLVNATVRLENDSTQTLSLPPQEWVVGMATPMSLTESSGRYSDYALGVMWFDGGKTHEIRGESYFSTRGFACTPRTPPAEYRSGPSPVVWAAVQNQFFALAVMPSLQQPAGEVIMRPVPLPPPTAEDLRENPQANRAPEGYFATMIYPALTIAPGTNVVRQFALFAGPKEYRTLATISATLKNSADSIMGFHGFFGFFSKGLLLAMNWLHGVLRVSYGWTIVAITFIIRLIFWPLTKASTRSMKRMQELQPQAKAIQEKYKADPMKAQKKMMELWKENRVSPMSGCWPMLLQIPVLFGFFYMLRSAIELRGAPFLWVADLSKPDTLFIIPGLNLPFNLLPLLMGGTQVWQAHLTPVSPGADPTQQKMMRYMPVLMLAFFYFLPSGLTLYYTVSSVLTIIQTKMTKAKPAPEAAAPGLTPPQKKKK